ncbi:MAG: exodeoxyribonuclease III [Spirochaetaceae bacterium]|jgi:exodeoxyribonuclease-3|nr:exodeoxyribonuclease III [Spirochaetaceae bacterium]
MRIISWNVNGIRSVEKRGFLEWVRKESPDMLCLQETKAHPRQISQALLSPPDWEGREYASYWGSAKKPGYSGVALYAKKQPMDVKPLGIPEFDDEGRTLQADFGDFVLICAYFPNSQEGGARLSYKLAFCQAIRESCDALIAAGRHLVLCGDYNIAHTPIDLARPKENEKNPGYLPEERAWMDAFTRAGYVDTFRAFHPGESGHYTWWSYRSGARERNIGWRIDYHCVDSGFAPQVRHAAILTDVAGSDHCPIQVDLDI